MSSETCDGGRGAGVGLNKRPKEKRKWLRRRGKLREPKNAGRLLGSPAWWLSFAPTEPLGPNWEREVLRQQVGGP